jgi:hypothetical protein
MDTEMPVFVVNRDGWRILHDGVQTRAFRCQADAIKIAREIARFSKASVLVGIDEVTFYSARDMQKTNGTEWSNQAVQKP